MHSTLTVKHGHKDAELAALFERECARVEKRIANEPPDAVALSCVLDRNPHCQEAYASLTLRMSGCTLNAHGVGPVLQTALRDATDELLVELDRWRRHVRESERANSTRRMTGGFDADLRVERVVRDDGHDDALEPVLRTALPELHRFVKKELDRHRAVLDRPELVAIDAADVVEEALLTALSSRASKPAEVPFDRWLLSCAYDVIVREEGRMRPRASLEDEVKVAAPIEGETSAEEIVLNGRDLDVRWLADSIRTDVRSADEEACGRDVRLAALRAIRGLPGPSRRVLSLIALEGLDEIDAARRLRCTEDQVRSAVETAREAVRARLLGQGVLTR